MAEAADTPPVADPRGWSRRPAGSLRRFLELFVLSGFAVAQPILDVFGQAPETFVFRRVDRVGVLLFTLIVIVGPPLAMWFLGSVAAWLGDAVGVIAHAALMGLLWVVLAVEVLKRVGVLPPAAVILASLVLGVAAVVVSTTRKGLRLWLTYATPAPLVFALVFLLMSPVSAQVRLSDHVTAKSVDVGNPAPVIVVVFDEFPLASLVRPDGQLDSDLYPNFAALQRETHTFLNATSNSGSTTYSVPSLLSGRVPQDGAIPVATTQPDNLFTLLGKSHELRIHELLRICPKSLCPSKKHGGLLSPGLRLLLRDGWMTFRSIVDPRDLDVDEGNALFHEANGEMLAASRGTTRPIGVTDLRVPKRFTEFLDHLQQPARGSRPQFGFLHLLLPHAPWTMLPDGRYYLTPTGPSATLGDKDRAWNDQGRWVALARQRHLLQVQYVDRLVGALVGRLKERGLWHRSAVVITADHGASFEPGEPRREATNVNADQIAWVPLFVKEPGQRIGTTSVDNVQLIDVVPTLADILDLDVPWRVDGRSMFGPPRKLAKPRKFLSHGRMLALDGVTWRRELLEDSITRFAPRVGDPLRAYEVGRQVDLVGAPVADLASAGASAPMRASFDHPSMWADVDTTAPVLPVYVAGRLNDPRRAAASLIISVNGVVAAVSELVGPPESRQFAGLIPPPLLRNGGNDVRVYGVDHAGRVSSIPIR